MEQEHLILEQLKYHLDSAQKLAEKLSSKWGLSEKEVLEMVIKNSQK